MKKEYTIIGMIQDSNLSSQKKTAVIKKLRRIIKNKEGNFIDGWYISSSFVWDETIERFEYWNNLNFEIGETLDEN